MVISLIVAVLLAVFAVALMEFLVSKNFFVPRALKSEHGSVTRMLAAGSWVLAVTTTAVCGVGLVFILVTSPDSLYRLQGNGLGWDPVSLWKQMGGVAKAVVVVFFLMCGWAIGIVIDRALAFSAVRQQSRAFIITIDDALRGGKIDEAITVAQQNKKSHLAKVVTAYLQEFKAHGDSPDIQSEQIEASRRALERAEAIVHAELKRGLGGLATIGSTAPFVGLFGTVVGILNAFKEISTQKATGLGAVAGGISEALVTTAIGLFVAIPAVMMFNYFTKKAEGIDVEIDKSAKDMLARLSRSLT